MSCFLCNLNPNYLVKAFKYFNLVVDPYPLTKGHVMIIAKEHYGCIAELPDNFWPEFNFLYNKLLQIYKKLFGPIILYEHGRAGSCIKDAFAINCHHMHLHFLPLDVNIHPQLRGIFRCHYIDSLNEVVDLFNSFGNYLLFQDKDGNRKFYRAQDVTIDPHLLRTLISKALEKEYLSDWECYNNRLLQEENLNFCKELKNILS